jgi:hypothetical protein
MSGQIWGIHNDTLIHKLLHDGFLSVGRDKFGDFTRVRQGRDGITSGVDTCSPAANADC